MTERKKTPTPRAGILGEWVQVGQKYHLALECGVGVVLWKEGERWSFLVTGFGVLDDTIHDAGDATSLDAKKNALRWVGLRGSIVASQAAAALSNIGTGIC